MYVIFWVGLGCLYTNLTLCMYIYQFNRTQIFKKIFIKIVPTENLSFKIVVVGKNFQNLFHLHYYKYNKFVFLYCSIL